MKPIILITSCERDRSNGRNAAVRETWIRTWGHLVEHRFILGSGCENPQDDEIIFNNVDDGYHGVDRKQREACRWALANGYDYAFQCDADTYVVVPRLLASGFEKHDYIGYTISRPEHLEPYYAGGGCGYWLSARALQVLADASDESFCGWGDLWVGNCLLSADIHATHDERYWTDGHYSEAQGIQARWGGEGAFPYCDEGVWDIGIITAHLGRGTNQFDPQWMRECHESFLAWERRDGNREGA